MAPRTILASLFLSLTAAASFGGSTTPGGSLYARLGGASTVSIMVERAVTRVAASFDVASL